MKTTRALRGASLGLIGALLLAGCSGADANKNTSESESASSKTVTITDNHGEQTVDSPPRSVVATDNRTFETLDTWGVDLAAAPKQLLPKGISYADNDQVKDLGSHREPNLENVVAAQPDVVINGQRFAQYYDDIKKMVPDSAIVELDPRDDKPFDEELKRQISGLGTVFGKDDEAKKLNDEFDAAIERVKKAYDGQSVMGVITSGGDIGYVAPHKGRTIGPMFDILDLKPALKVEGSDDHQGDDISVEAIAESNPEIMLVMDRDAAIRKTPEGARPAEEIIDDSEALKNVPAVKNGAVVYMPDDTYTNEGIQTYTEFFNTLADRLEELKKKN